MAYSVKFMSGALHGEWMRNVEGRKVLELRANLAELLGQEVSDLYVSTFLPDSDGIPNGFAYKGENGKFSAVLYAIKEP